MTEIIEEWYDACLRKNTELKKRYDTCLRENTGLKIHNAYVEKKLAEAKEIIKDMLKDIPNRMWYTDDVIKRAEQFLEG